MKRPQQLHSAASFTLIELLLVIAVIAILSALVLRAGNYVRTRSAIAQCKAELAMLSSALDEYMKANGSHPQHGAEANCNRQALEAFYTAMLEGPVVYIDWPAERIANRRFLDPWGTPYCYHKNSDTGQFMLNPQAWGRTYVLYSNGPDRLSGTLDDISVDRAPLN